MSRLPRKFICGQDTSYPTIDTLPTNADHATLAYVDSIKCLCLYDMNTAQVYPTPPTGCAGSWIVQGSINGSGAPGSSTGVGTSWCVITIGSHYTDTTAGKSYICTALTSAATPVPTWAVTGSQS